MNMIKLSENDIKYIENRINEDIEILQLQNPTKIQHYAIERLSEYEYNIVSLNTLKRHLKIANDNKEINKQVEEYCIWIMGMWMELRFGEEVEELDAPYIDDGYRSIYGKIRRNENDEIRYNGDGITFYDAN